MRFYKRTCLDCKQLLPYLLRVTLSGKSYYTDDNDRPWINNRCSSCKSEDRRKYNKASTLFGKPILGKAVLRTCRKCGAGLSLNRYFNCASCVGSNYLDNYRLEGDYVY